MREEEVNKGFDYYHKFFNELKGGQSYKRLGKTFENEKKYYYDLGTGKVLECEKEVYDILKCLEETDSFESILNLKIDDNSLIEALQILKDAVDKENIMKAPPLRRMDDYQKTQLEFQVNNNLNQITLELTQRCNLRCRYCIYQDENGKFRNFSETEDMDFETAMMAIDYAVDHATGKDFFLTFYGGEPLLKFDLIKQCVEYLKSKKMKNNIFYSLTTNLTLMTEEKAEYLNSIPNFSVVCSIDGDEETHDANRLTVNNTGSHALAIEGLKNLTKAYGKEKIGQILINMVVSEPYTSEKFDRIQNFINTCPYIYPKMTIMYSYVDYGNKSDSDINLNLSKEEAFKYWNPIQKWEEKYNNDKRLFSTNNRLRGFLKIHTRGLSNQPMVNYPLNGCCIPGGRKLYVTSNGEFQVCEQMGQGPVIGNVREGINLDILQKKFIDEYNNESLSDCSNCWAVRLCSLCYARCYDENGINMSFKKSKCFHERRMAEYSLSEYHRVLEENPESLEILNDMI